MAVDVTVTTRINRPPAEVAAYASDPSNAPTWYRRISSVDWVTDPPAVQGSRMMFCAKFMGRNLRYTYEIIDLHPGQTLAMRTSEGPFPMNTVYTWSGIGADATQMTLRNHGVPTGFSKLTAPLMSFAMRRAMTQDLAALKRILEAKAFPGGGRDARV